MAFNDILSYLCRYLNGMGALKNTPYPYTTTKNKYYNNLKTLRQ